MANITLAVVPRAVPKLAIHPRDAGDEAIGFDGAQHFSGLGIHLMDLAPAMLPYPERALGPGQS